MGSDATVVPVQSEPLKSAFHRHLQDNQDKEYTMADMVAECVVSVIMNFDIHRVNHYEEVLQMSPDGTTTGMLR